MMAGSITLDTVGEARNFLRQMYDSVRLVDPVGKRVLEYLDGKLRDTGSACYEYWQCGRICDHCISVRACRENKSFVKLEYAPGKIMLVAALPVASGQDPLVLELLKDVTETLMIGRGMSDAGRPLQEAVRDYNDLAVKDGLTSLYNRRFLDERLPVDIEAAAAAGRPLSVIFLDIDNMKAVNDTFGHVAGDEAIRRAAETIQSCVRPESGWAARYGGDEFFVCLSGVDLAAAQRVAERIQREFENLPPLRAGGLRLSVSQGAAAMPEGGCAAEELLRLSDGKMYEQKRKKKREG